MESVKWNRQHGHGSTGGLGKPALKSTGIGFVVASGNWFSPQNVRAADPEPVKRGLPLKQ
jgi:hypothetical protein